MLIASVRLKSYLEVRASDACNGNICMTQYIICIQWQSHMAPLKQRDGLHLCIVDWKRKGPTARGRNGSPLVCAHCITRPFL